MKILYITGNDEMPFYSVDGMIPFSHIIEANGINEDSIFSAGRSGTAVNVYDRQQ